MLEPSYIFSEVSMQQFIIKFVSLNLVLISLASAKIWRPLDDLSSIYTQEARSRSAKAVQELGLKQYADFVTMDVNTYELNPYYNNDSLKPIFLSKTQAEASLMAANRNPVVGLHMYNKYDPNNQGIGFCFGRAMFIDLYLSINEFNRASIKKAFVVGPMTSGDGANWGWHVTTIAQSFDRNKNEIWLAIDPIMGRVMEVKEWYKETLKMSTDGKLRLYITDAGKFAQSATRYDEQAISHKFYNQYFGDMMKWFEKNDVSRELKLQ